MANINIQLQNYKFQLKNIESQFENIMNIPNLNLVVNTGIQILNVGLQMISSVMQMHIFEIDYLNLNQQIQNIKTQILNIEMEINNNINMKMNQINNMQMNNFLLMQNDNIQKNIIEKKHVTFRSNTGKRWNMQFDREITVSEMLKQFLVKIEKPELFKTDEIFFLFNATKLNWGDNTKIRDKFSLDLYPSIAVVDAQPLIGG